MENREKKILKIKLQNEKSLRKFLENRKQHIKKADTHAKSLHRSMTVKLQKTINYIKKTQEEKLKKKIAARNKKLSRMHKKEAKFQEKQYFQNMNYKLKQKLKS